MELLALPPKNVVPDQVAFDNNEYGAAFATLVEDKF